MPPLNIDVLVPKKEVLFKPLRPGPEKSPNLPKQFDQCRGII